MMERPRDSVCYLGVTVDLPNLKKRVLWRKREKTRKLLHVQNSLYPFNQGQRGMRLCCLECLGQSCAELNSG